MRERFLEAVVRVVRRAAPVVLIVAALLSALSFSRAQNIEFKSSQLDMIPRENPVVRHWIKFTEDFDILSDLFVVVRSSNLAAAKGFAIALKEELKSKPDLVRDVDFRLDPALYKRQGLYFLARQELLNIRQGVTKQKEDLKLLASEPGFGGLMRVFRYELDREEDAPADEMRGFFGFIRDVGRGLESAAAGTKTTGPPWKAFFGAGETKGGREDPFADDGWKLSTKKDGLLVFVHPANSTDEFDFIVPFFETCRAVIDKLKVRFPGVEVGLAGQPAMIYSQKDTVGNDLHYTSLVSAVGVSIVFVWGLRGVGLPLLAMISLMAGIAWSFGVLSVTPGHLNLITTAFVSLLMGEGMDYGIYIVSQFGERRRAGMDVPDSVEGALMAAGPGILTGGFTSCAGFLALMMTDFTGFRELGQIAGSGIILCMLAMLVLLPALLILAGRAASSLGTGDVGRADWLLGKLAEGAVANGVPVLVFFFGGAFFFGIQGLGIGFDYNLLNLEPEGTEAVVYEQILQRDFEIAPDTLMVTVPTLEKAHEKVDALRKLPSVGSVDSLSNFLPEGAADKQKLLLELAAEVRGLRFGKPAPIDVDRLLTDLDAIKRKLRELKLPILIAKEAEVVLSLHEAEEATAAAAAAIRAVPAEQRKSRLASYEAEIFAELASGFEDFREMLGPAPLTAQHLPPSLAGRFRGKSGRYAIFVSPAVDVRLESQAKLFIRQVSSVDPEVTGVPVLIDEVMTLLKRGFRQATIYSLLAVVLLVFLDFRNVRETALALAPLLVSLAWTVGLMRTMGVQYNPANFVSLPMLTGLGMAFGVYLLHRVRQDPEADPVKAVQSTGKSIVLSCMGTLVGFGSLMLAKNRGLWSLGWILCVGMTCCLVTSLLMLPPLLELLGRRESLLSKRVRSMKETLLGFRF